MGTTPRDQSRVSKSWGWRLLYTWLCVSFLSHFIASAQVVNDNISSRSLLILDSASTYSSTDEATVEWECINRALTNKCLIYHNDQWFTFKVKTGGKYFLNLSSQNCRDAKGIQAIIIEGNPCEVSTYKILHCIPRISEHDVFIELDSLKSGTPYLVNIDGFLGDFCRFNIQLSSHPSGVSQRARNLDTLNLSATNFRNIVRLEWTLPPTFKDNIQAFEIYRRTKGEARMHFLGNVHAEFNTLGKAKTIYSFYDTLKSENTYTYEILGVLIDGVKEIMDERTISFYENRSRDQTLNLFLDFKDGTDIRILLLDKKRDKILSQSAFRFRKVEDANQRMNVASYIQRGIRNYIVRVISAKPYNATDYEFVVLDDGSIKRN